MRQLAALATLSAGGRGKADKVHKQLNGFSVGSCNCSGSCCHPLVIAANSNSGQHAIINSCLTEQTSRNKQFAV